MTVDYEHRGGAVLRQLRSVEFLGDQVAITYSTIPDDLRATGLIHTHTLLIPLGEDEYDQEFTHAYEAVLALLNDALEDLQLLEPYDPREQRDPDDDDEDD